MGKILSVDYGKKRIGFALSDIERKFSFPLIVLENKNFSYVLSYIKEIITEHEVDLIIIGLPFNMPEYKNQTNLKSKMAIEIENFVNNLKNEIRISIEIVDERLSSFMAGEKLKEAGLSAKKIKEVIDKEAARFLLENYIESLIN